jgi:hypothetical protein
MNRKDFIRVSSLFTITLFNNSLSIANGLQDQDQDGTPIFLLIRAAGINRDNFRQRIRMRNGLNGRANSRYRTFNTPVERGERLVWRGTPDEADTRFKIVIDNIFPKDDQTVNILRNGRQFRNSYVAKISEDAEFGQVMEYNITFSVFRDEELLGQFTIDPKLKVKKT